MQQIPPRAMAFAPAMAATLLIRRGWHASVIRSVRDMVIAAQTMRQPVPKGVESMSKVPARFRALMIIVRALSTKRKLLTCGGLVQPG